MDGDDDRTTAISLRHVSRHSTSEDTEVCRDTTDMWWDRIAPSVVADERDERGDDGSVPVLSLIHI